MAGDTVLTVSSRALLRACEQLGLRGDDILGAAAVPRAVIEDADARLAIEDARALWAAALTVSGDPELALHAAEALPFGAYKVIDYLAASAPTIGEAMRGIARYFPLINTAIELAIQDRGDAWCVVARSPGHPAAATATYMEYVLAMIYLRLRHASGGACALVGVELGHAAPARTTEHERVFGCPVRFAAPACRMVLTAATWDAAMARPDDPLHRVLDDHARLLLARLPAADGLLAELRQLIAGELRGGDPSLGHVAKRLGTSARTLQRRLNELGAVYGDLVDDLRRTAALGYLEDRELALGEIAYLLGFGEQSSFTRAFKRWTGRTPIEHRRGR